MWSPSELTASASRCGLVDFAAADDRKFETDRFTARRRLQTLAVFTGATEPRRAIVNGDGNSAETNTRYTQLLFNRDWK